MLLANAQEALRESEARFREQAALLDIAHDAIYVRDLDGHITYWNKGAEQAYGWTADEAVGRRAVELLCKEPSEYQAAEAALLLNGAWQGEMARRTNADRDITMAVRWTLVRDAQGHPKSILAINTDITAQKMAVEALAELSRRTERRERILTSTLSSISDFAYIYDRDGRFLFVNQPLLDLWGITLEDAVGKNFFDLGYPHDLAEQLQRQIQRGVRDEEGPDRRDPLHQSNRGRMVTTSTFSRRHSGPMAASSSWPERHATSRNARGWRPNCEPPKKRRKPPTRPRASSWRT